MAFNLVFYVSQFHVKFAENNEISQWKTSLSVILVTLIGECLSGFATIFFETGPLGFFVLLFGLGFMISDAIRARKEAEAELRKRKCEEWTKWCKWGKKLFVKFHFL